MIFIKGDRVTITANDARRGQTGTVTGEKTAVDDLWVMVEINGEIEFYKPEELTFARDRRQVRKNIFRTVQEAQL